MARISLPPTIPTTVPIKATAAELNTGTDNTKFATALGLAGRDGWQAAGETWTTLGTSAQIGTITVPGDVSVKYAKGDRIQLTQGTTLYFYISNNPGTIAGGSTSFEVAAGTQYVLGTAAITAPFFSKVDSPQGFPVYFNWSSTVAAGAPMTYTGTIQNAKFMMKGGFVYYTFQSIGTTSGNVSNQLTFTLPVNSNAGGLYMAAGYGEVVDNSVDIQAFTLLAGADATKVLVLKYNAANYGSAVQVYIKQSGFYI